MGTLADLAESGDADALSAAIADGAHLDEADDEGNTATHKAAQGEKTSVLRRKTSARPSVAS